jgi:hypothetical protein
MNSKHSENSSKRMITRTRNPRGEKRHRDPARKNHPTKPRNLDKREKLKTSRCRTSEFAPLRWTNAYDFSDWAHGLHPNQYQYQDLPEDTHCFLKISGIPYTCILSVCDETFSIYADGWNY